MSFKYFKREDFACKHCGENLIQDEFIARLDDLRGRVGFPLIVTSGYRCQEYNAKVSSTGTTGPHVTGMAADFAVSHTQAYAVLRDAFEMGFPGIGVNQKGSARFIHVDDVPRVAVWSY